MNFQSRFRPAKQKKCWCGSGSKQKNCHPNVSKQLHPPIEKPAPAPSSSRQFFHRYQISLGELRAKNTTCGWYL